MAFIVVAVVLVALLLFIIGMYNSMVRLRNEVRNSYSQIDVQLKRRYDLIPNLVETAKGYMKHESGTLEAVIQARNSASAFAQAVAQNPSSGENMKKLVGAEDALGSVLSKFVALAESYPDLKANTTMAQLIEELTSTENKVSFARQAYNDSVMSYNNSCESFPTALIAKNFGFELATHFQVEKSVEREPVRVQFQ
jgi:LemA protein